jgi:histidinol-phosphate aminotransferase
MPSRAAAPGQPDARIPNGAPGVGLIKPGVRSLAAYTLDHPVARRKLNQNESPYDVPEPLKRAIAERVVAASWNRYPEFVPSSLLDLLASRYGWVPDGVLVGNGSNELIQATLAVTLREGDAIVASAPTFSLYRLLAGVFGARYHAVPLGLDFAFDVERLVETAVRERARVVVLNSPNNPTGSALPPGAVERLLAETDAMIVCDEAYQDFGGPTALPLLSDTSRVVVLRTFSKALGMAGLRFGLALSHPAVAREIAKAKLPYNVNVMTLAAAEILLGHADAWAGQVAGVVATREAALARIRRIEGLRAYDSAANFFLIRFHSVPAREVFRRLYEEHGILVRDVSGVAELAGCLRISVGTEDDMEAVAAALEEIVGGRR